MLSHHLHQNQIHNNYYIATDGEYAGKIVEKNSLGEEVRPIDLSLTKNVCGLLLSCCILLFIILRTARWYKKHPNEVPDGFTGLMEMAVTYLQENVIKESKFDKVLNMCSNFDVILVLPIGDKYNLI